MEKSKSDAYTKAKELISAIGINQTVIIDMPENVKFFRKYLNELTRGGNKQN